MSKQKKTVYVAGPMRGRPYFNFPAFEAATEALREKGYLVISPAEVDLKDGIKPKKNGSTSAKLSHFLKRDIPLMLDCDIVAVLPGWTKSKGATSEVYVARKCDKEVYSVKTLLNGDEK